MPKLTDIKSILIIGSGPIRIGQACEFDYSGVQACKALKEEGYRVVLINSNPATIMTDPELADATYIEPINWQTIENIIKKEKPDALLPTMGGQTALNCTQSLIKHNILEKYNVKLIGANGETIEKAESRDKFKHLVQNLGLNSPQSFIVSTLADVETVKDNIDFPVMVRSSYTLGGSGSGIAYNVYEFVSLCKNALDLSPISEILIEESLVGWKEIELEVIRDCNDNCIVVCTLENFDPMGVHTGDSITVAPAQTITDVEYHNMRNAAFAILREIGVDTGGANVQFAIHPATGEIKVIEVNPRVSRSSALASKATGFPIARIAAKLAIGYTLDELQNEIVDGIIPASFEPTIDYVVVKIPRFDFDKFPYVKSELTTKMQSVGEVMAIGPTFIEAIQKAIISLDVGFNGFVSQIAPDLNKNEIHNIIEKNLKIPNPSRLLYIADAYRNMYNTSSIAALTKIDPWFLIQIEYIVIQEREIAIENKHSITKEKLLSWKQHGFSDTNLAFLCSCTEIDIRNIRKKYSINMTFERIDSCAAEFQSRTSYLYSNYYYDANNEASTSKKEKVIVLGSGPNRIGQGIEFDYCCVQAVQSLKSMGFEAIMINCNPETVSTDYDIADKLYFEPINEETILEIVGIEKPIGIVIQFGGQTPLKIASALENAGIKILGTIPSNIALAEDREEFTKIINKLNLKQVPYQIINDASELVNAINKLYFPVIIRPSYVLGGRAMAIINNIEELQQYIKEKQFISESYPILIEKYLTKAIEVDVDAIADKKGNVFIAGIMEHVEFAGVHSGDSSCVIPTRSLSITIQNELIKQMKAIAKELKIIGFVNAQFALKDDEIYLLEVNPRASRTIPFLSKAIGVPLVEIAVSCLMGQDLKELSIHKRHNLVAVKCPAFSEIAFYNNGKLPIGPEMKSTGEVMSFGETFEQAYAKCLISSGINIVDLTYKNINHKDKIGIEKCMSDRHNFIHKLQEL